MVSSTVASLKPQEATLHCNAIWAFALQALCVREDKPGSIPVVHPVEDAAIQLVLALTLKLTEATFKPLFLRLIDWAAQPPASGGNLVRHRTLRS